MSIVLKYAIPVLLIAPLFFAQQTPNTTIEPSEYEVYSTVIRHLSLNPGNGPLIIKDHTEVVGAATIIDTRQYPYGTLEDFLKKNMYSAKLQEQFPIDEKYYLISEDEAYTRGYFVVGLSRVGFNRSKDRALVYVTYSMGGRNVKERYFSLTKTGDQWVVQGTLGVLKILTICG